MTQPKDIEGLRKLRADLHVAALPTKSEVVVLCGAPAAEARDAIDALLSELEAVKGELANTKYVLEEIRAAHDVSVELHLAAEQALSDLKGEVLEKVGPLERLVAACVEDFGEPDEDDADDEAVGAGVDSEMAIKFGHIREALRALSSLHQKLGSIGGSSSTETAASLADGKLTAGEAQRKSEGAG